MVSLSLEVLRRLTSFFLLLRLILVFRHQDWLGEGHLRIRGLHPTGARADVGKSTVICGMMS
jgi:hypothetical protein